VLLHRRWLALHLAAWQAAVAESGVVFGADAPEHKADDLRAVRLKSRHSLDDCAFGRIVRKKSDCCCALI